MIDLDELRARLDAQEKAILLIAETIKTLAEAVAGLPSSNDARIHGLFSDLLGYAKTETEKPPPG